MIAMLAVGLSAPVTRACRHRCCGAGSAIATTYCGTAAKWRCPSSYGCV